MKLFLESIPLCFIKKMLLKNVIPVIIIHNIYLWLHTLVFQLIVIWSSAAQIGVFSRIHTAPNSLPEAKICYVLYEVFLASWLVRLVFLIVWFEVEGKLFVSSIFSINNVCCDSWCDNFEKQEVRMVRLLRMVRPRSWKDSFFVHIQSHLLMNKTMWVLLKSVCVCVWIQNILLHIIN